MQEQIGDALGITPIHANRVIKQIFEDGLYHADPHPGNFIRMPDGRLGLIDFGNVGKFTVDMMDDLVLLLHHLVRRDYRSIARLVLKIGRPAKDVDPKSLAYIDGTEMDFVKEGLNEGFKFRNPNQKGECGCGESFTV